MMPFISHHLGAGLFLGFWLRKRINWFTFLITTIVVDIEPIYVIVFNPLSYKLHGYMHIFLASITIGSLVGLLIYLIRRLIVKPFEGLDLT